MNARTKHGVGGGQGDLDPTNAEHFRLEASSRAISYTSGEGNHVLAIVLEACLLFTLVSRKL